MINFKEASFYSKYTYIHSLGSNRFNTEEALKEIDIQRSDVFSMMQSKRDHIIAQTRNSTTQMFKKSIKDFDKIMAQIPVDSPYYKNEEAFLQAVSDDLVSRLNDSSIDDLEARIAQILEYEDKAFSAFRDITKDKETLNITKFRDLLEAIKQSVNLLSDSRAQKALMALLELKGTNTKNYFSLIGSRIENNNELKKLVLDAPEIQLITERLITFFNNQGNNFKNGTGTFDNKKGSAELAKAKSSALKNGVFSTGIGEALAQQIVGRIKKDLVSTLTSLSSTSGNIEVDAADILKGSKNNTYKSDLITDNVQLSIQATKDTQIEIQLRLGSSVKFYDQLRKKKSSNDYKSLDLNVGGSGYNLMDFFNELHISDKFTKYAFFNSFTHPAGPEYNEYLSYFTDLMARRYVTNILSISNRANDYAQIIIVNGQAFSLYDLVMQVLNSNKFLLSNSLDTKKEQPIAISLTNRKDVFKANEKALTSKDTLSELVERHGNVEKALNTVSIHGKVHFQQLLKLRR